MRMLHQSRVWQWPVTKRMPEYVCMYYIGGSAASSASCENCDQKDGGTREVY